jgi:hypothetical protein
MMKDETAGVEIGEFAGPRSKCYAFSIERPDMKIDFNNAEPTYTRAPYNMSELITSNTKYIGGVLRSFVKDSRSTVVCEEVKKDNGIKKNIVAREIMLEDYNEVLFTGIPQYRRMNMIRN